jgi:hypothetical protein
LEKANGAKNQEYTLCLKYAKVVACLRCIDVEEAGAMLKEMVAKSPQSIRFVV